MGDSKERLVDTVVLGSGFVGQYIFKNLQSVDHKLTLLDISPTKIKIESIDERIFSATQFNKTANKFGGIPVWGNALTLPAHDQYFMDESTHNWNQVENSIDWPKLFSHFGVSRKNFNLNLLEKLSVNRSFPGITQKFEFEVNNYSQKLLNEKNFQEKSKLVEPMSCRILNISKIDDYWYVKTDLDEYPILKSTNVVFAAGAIGNAVLAFLATGESNFRFGNHISAECGKVQFMKLKKTLYISNIFQRKFITFSKRSEPSLPRSAIRFQGDQELSFERNLVDFLKNKIKIYSIFLMSFLGFQTKATLRVMSEYYPDTCRISISKNENSYICKLDTDLDCEFVNSAEDLCKDMESFLSALSFKVVMRKNLKWTDAAHYFGTIPMTDDLNNFGVNDKYQINQKQGLFAVGASSFARGSHGHPTMLAIGTAIDFVKKFKAVSSEL